MDFLDIKHRRLTLVGSIDENTLRTVLVAFDALEAKSKRLPIHITLNTDGGGAYASLGIYDRIKASPCKVTIECFGEIMSGGTIILQAAHQRLLHLNSRFMIHYGTTCIASDANMNDAANQLKFEKTVDVAAMERIYLEKINIPRHKLKKLLSTDSYFTAAQAVSLGFADRVIMPRKKK